MKQITTPTCNDQYKQKWIWNADHTEIEEIETIYSKRCGIIDEQNLSALVRDVFNEIWNRDDFGIVELFTNKNNQAIRMLINNSNLGYGIRMWINNNPIPSFIVNGSLSIDQAILEGIA